jgi:hypothetical protein
MIGNSAPASRAGAFSSVPSCVNPTLSVQNAALVIGALKLTTRPGTKGEFHCVACNRVLEVFDGVTEVAIRLTGWPRSGAKNRHTLVAKVASEVGDAPKMVPSHWSRFQSGPLETLRNGKFGL